MDVKQIARELGRRGGKARARRLSIQRKKEIASAGGRARVESLQLARRIEKNFRYVQAIRAMIKPIKVRSLKTVPGKLPGIYE